MAGSADKDGPITDINVTPLVDVVLVLLIIFMATAPLLQKRALPVHVPRAATSEKKATAALEIAVTREGLALVGEQTLSLGALVEEVKRRRALDPLLAVSVAGDEDARYEDVVTVLDVVRGAGVRKVALDVRPAAS